MASLLVARYLTHTSKLRFGIVTRQDQHAYGVSMMLEEENESMVFVCDGVAMVHCKRGGIMQAGG